VAVDNSLNTGKGRTFQILAAHVLGRTLKTEFLIDEPLPIGHPPKLHRFDLVSTNHTFVGEAKNYSWTETGNMPSAKMGFVNEALLYLSYVPSTAHRFIAMRLDRHARRDESLCEYYFRTYKHLLGSITVYEIDAASGQVREHRLGSELA
jgi:hypothetical protein